MTFLDILTFLTPFLASLPGVWAIYRQWKLEKETKAMMRAETKKVEAETDQVEADSASKVTSSAIELVERLEARLDKMETSHQTEKKEWEARFKEMALAHQNEKAEWAKTLENMQAQLDRERRMRRALELKFREAQQAWEKSRLKLTKELENEQIDRERLKNEFASCTIKLSKLIDQIEDLGGKPDLPDTGPLG